MLGSDGPTGGFALPMSMRLMKITYDPKANLVAIILHADRSPVDSLDLEDEVTADLDSGGHVVGLEILDARERFGCDPLDCITIERLTEHACDEPDLETQPRR
jgi:uncharacterized protein YuzE